METMRAAVLKEPGRLRIEERPLPRPGPGEVLVEVKACGICGSDLHVYEGHHPRATYPRVMGHEFSGAVAALGEGVEGWEVGGRVCCETNIPCRRCELCRAGMAHLCPSIEVIGFNRDGAYAEYVLNRAENLVPLPDNLSFLQGAATQPLGVGYHALVERGRLRCNDTVVVLGAGPVGLGTAAIAKAAGARVMVVDTVPYRLQVARAMGAEEAVRAGESDPVEAARRFTGGRGADFVAEVVGGDQDVTARWALEMVRPGGTVVIVGTFARSPAVSLNAVRFKEAHVIGSRGQYGTFPPCLELVSGGRISVDPMISGTVPLEELEAQLLRMRRPEKDFAKILVAYA